MLSHMYPRQRTAQPLGVGRPHWRCRCKSIRMRVHAAASDDEDTVWYFAFGGDTNRFCLANAGITPRSIVPAAVVNKQLTFDACGLSEVFEPAFADLRDVPGGLAYGALLSVERTALPALRSIDGVLDREESTVKALTYDGKRRDAVAYVSRADARLWNSQAGVDARPSARLVEVMVEAARLLGHEPVHIKWLEAREVLQLPESRLMPQLPPDAEPVTASRLAASNGVASSRSLMAVGGLVYDVGAEASDATWTLLGFRANQVAGKDMTADFLRRLYVADLPSSNPDHWPRAPTTLTLTDLLNAWLPQSEASSSSTSAAAGSSAFVPGAALVLSPEAVADEEALGSRRLDVLAGWCRYLATAFPLVGYTSGDPADEG